MEALMAKDIVMYTWDVHVIGYIDVGYRYGCKQITTDVQVIAQNKKDAKRLAEQEACNQDASFVFARIKIRRKDIKKIL
jgi:hypothetical protein